MSVISIFFIEGGIKKDSENGALQKKYHDLSAKLIGKLNPDADLQSRSDS